MTKRGWVMTDVVGMSVVNSRKVTRVEGPSELLEEMVRACENGYWECDAGHVRPCHSLEYAKAKHEHLEEYMPEICGVGDCMRYTIYHQPVVVT